MVDDKKRLEEILNELHVREYNEKVVGFLRDSGVDFNNFESVLSNIKLFSEKCIELYNNGQGMHFNSVVDELIHDGSWTIAPNLAFSIYPEFYTVNKVGCFVDAVQNTKDKINCHCSRKVYQ
jgi:hypothetical protein